MVNILILYDTLCSTFVLTCTTCLWYCYQKLISKLTFGNNTNFSRRITGKKTKILSLPNSILSRRLSRDTRKREDEVFRRETKLFSFGTNIVVSRFITASRGDLLNLGKSPQATEAQP